MQCSSGYEDVPLAILEEFNIDLYSNENWGRGGDNPLAWAAICGHKKLIQLAMNRGFVKLLTYSNREDQLLVEVALTWGQRRKYSIAAVMLREMND